MRAVMGLVTARRTVIVTLVVAIITLGNGLAHRQEPVGAGSVTPSAPHDDEMIKGAIEALVPPRIGLPRRPTASLKIDAKAYIVVDSDHKYPLAAKEANTPLPIASITKIMTALIALETLSLDEVLTVPRQAAIAQGSEIQLTTGEKMTVRNLLYALLVTSANDAAYTLATAHDPLDQFVSRMNEKARLLGLRQTTFKDPAGLEGTSTPRDLAVLTDYALGNQLFRSIVGKEKYTINSADDRFSHELTNSNRLVVRDEALFYSYAVGVKTGFTPEAGHCLVAAAEYASGARYIAVVLNTNEQSKEASAREARKLLTWASGQ